MNHVRGMGFCFWPLAVWALANLLAFASLDYHIWNGDDNSAYLSALWWGLNNNSEVVSRYLACSKLSVTSANSMIMSNSTLEVWKSFFEEGALTPNPEGWEEIKWRKGGREEGGSETVPHRVNEVKTVTSKTPMATLLLHGNVNLNFLRQTTGKAPQA